MKPTQNWIFVLLVLSSVIASAQDNSKTSILNSYVAVQESLAGDDLPKAKKALEALALQGDPELTKLAEAAGIAKDIDEMRKGFAELSAYVAKWDPPNGYVVAFCPMAGKDGASWIQKEGALANPYFGKKMLTCGSIKKRGQ